jgi:hypothetical protein
LYSVKGKRVNGEFRPLLSKFAHGRKCDKQEYCCRIFAIS